MLSIVEGFANDLSFKTSLMLNELPFGLYPTGSRYFGHHTLESDWDFAATYSEEVLACLRGKGFEVIVNPYTADPDTGKIPLESRPDNNTVVVVEHTIEGQTIQINLVRDIDEFLFIRRSLDNSVVLREYHKRLTSAERQFFWDTMGRVYRDNFLERWIVE